MEKFLIYIKTNYRSLLGALAMGIFVWLVVASDKEYTHIIDVPIELQTIGEGLVLKSIPPKTVKLRVKGRGRSLFALSFVEQKIGVEFPEILESQVINLNDYIGKFQFPQDLNITVRNIIAPTKIKLEVDGYTERILPINVNSTLKTMPGYILVGHTTNVDSVLISGPKSLIEPLNRVQSETIVKNDIRFPFEQELKLISPKPGVLKIKPEQIIGNFVIEQLVERTIYNIPIQILNVPEGIRAQAFPQTISVRVKGGETKISQLTANDIQVLFNYTSEYQKGKTEYLMQIKVPENVEWMEASPHTFTLKLIMKDES